MTARSSIIRSILLSSAALAILARACSCLQFNYPSFDATSHDDFSFSPGSGIANGSLHVTPVTGDMSHRSGRVTYARETLKLWSSSNRTDLTSFLTEFVFSIVPRDNGTPSGEGMAFLLTSNPALPSNSSGQWLGVVNAETDGAATNRVVAIEFDTRKSYEEDVDGNHVGLDVNSIRSALQYPLSNLSIVLSSGADVSARVGYNGTLMSLELVQEGRSFVYMWLLDLSTFLLQDVTLGFSASTGEFSELNQIKSWNFTTVDEAVADGEPGRRKNLINLYVGLLIPLAAGVSLLVFLVWRALTRQRRLAYRNLEKMIDAHGPVKFKLRELRRATAGFSLDRKLGRGGFGTVYLGYLYRMNMEVAVKRVATTNRSSHGRGEQEFVAEVNTIGKLSHRNLVKLIGWCHDKGELLLVYELFPMGSLDKLLYANGARASSASTSEAPHAPELTWERRYKIVCGVASALDYLHHGSSKRILHRDVKASNVMLDEECNAKLGDFGLARVIQHDGVTHHSTQAIAGTRAYMAHESFFTGRASLDTDVYAFGVFVLEVLSGRSPSSSVLWYDDDDGHHDEPSRRGRQPVPMHVVDWAWRLYSEGRELQAADAALNGEFDEAQVDCAVRLALACCHPNPRERPSMRTVVQVLIGGAPAPEPPFEKPAFVWPPDGRHQEIELPHVGVLFMGGQHQSYCSLSSTSITGR